MLPQWQESAAPLAFLQQYYNILLLVVFLLIVISVSFNNNIVFQKPISDRAMSDSSEEEKQKGKRARGADSRSDLQKRARKLQASCHEDNYRQTVKDVKSDLHALKEGTQQRPKRGNVPQPSISSRTRSSAAQLLPTADSELPLPNSELPLPERELPLPDSDLLLPDRGEEGREGKR